MSQYHISPFLVVCIMLYSVVQIYAQPRYTLTDLGAFQPQAIAGPYIVGSENGLPVRLNIETGEKIILGFFAQPLEKVYFRNTPLEWSREPFLNRH